MASNARGPLEAPLIGFFWIGLYWLSRSEEAENRLILLRGEGESRTGELTASVKRQQLSALLIRIGERELVRTGVEGVDHAPREILAVLHDRQVCTERSRPRAECIRGALQRRDCPLDVRILGE